MPSWIDRSEGAPIPTQVPNAMELADTLERALAAARVHDADWGNQEERRALIRAQAAIALTLERHQTDPPLGSTQAIYGADMRQAERVRRGDFG